MSKQYRHNLITSMAMIVILMTLVLSQTVQAKWSSRAVAYEPQSSFVFKFERSSDPQYQYNVAVDAYDAADYRAAAKIFMELAKSGHVNAQYQIAVMFDSGIGVEEDHAQAAIWYQKAATKGHNEAQYNLAIAYATGEGIHSNMRKAIYWMKKSALRGNINSQYNLGLIYILGNGVAVNFEEGMQWWKLAAKNGDSMAQYNIGMMYLEGKGVKSDVCEASRWWKMSAENGLIQSVMALQGLKNSNIQATCLDMVSIN